MQGTQCISIRHPPPRPKTSGPSGMRGRHGPGAERAGGHGEDFRRTRAKERSERANADKSSKQKLMTESSGQGADYGLRKVRNGADVERLHGASAGRAAVTRPVYRQQK